MYRKKAGFSDFLVDPTKITKFDCTNEELELLILFWICAAGKNAMAASEGLDKLLSLINGHKKPFQTLRLTNDLPLKMKQCGIGCFNNKARSFIDLANSNLNLKTCQEYELENIFGIGLKTSRCFLMHSRKNSRFAGLDVHILHFLRDKGFDVPKSTPSSKKKYEFIQKIFINIADELNLPAAELDLKIWNEYSGRI